MAYLSKSGSVAAAASHEFTAPASSSGSSRGLISRSAVTLQEQKRIHQFRVGGAELPKGAACVDAIEVKAVDSAGPATTKKG
jgi:hypothetical protein